MALNQWTVASEPIEVPLFPLATFRASITILQAILIGFPFKLGPHMERPGLFLNGSEDVRSFHQEVRKKTFAIWKCRQFTSSKRLVLFCRGVRDLTDVVHFWGVRPSKCMQDLSVGRLWQHHVQSEMHFFGRSTSVH